VGGIKTTLPFFRDVMLDDEFVDGKLDTGFISRFNERRKAKRSEEVEADLAVIAAAASFAEQLKTVSVEAAGRATLPSLWVMAGRADLQRRRQRN
jgi:acetyl/propionyl-CoA carboxylase alpha subunit